MRDIKFKIWLPKEKKMSYPFDITELPDKTQLHGGETFLQFIGLSDDNDVEIYEGDIIQFILGELLSVEWNDDICQWQFSDGSPINNGENYSIYKLVVGNIYENPELL